MMYRKIRKCIGKFLQKLSNYMLYGSNYEILCAADIDERVETIENIAESRGVEIDKEALLDALIGSIVIFERLRKTYLPKTEEDCAELWTLSIYKALDDAVE